MIQNNTLKDNVLPKRKIDKVIVPIYRYLQVETTAGIVLIIATAIALLWANLSEISYQSFWNTPIGLSFGGFEFNKSFHWWINDALMALFFFVIGLEVKGEFINGELKNPKAASLPIIAAVGGMLVPALFYLFTCPSGTSVGWGVPVATDIAFVVGAMALLGTRVPRGLHIMILTLAIADDIGAILVIAFGYSGNINIEYLLIAISFLVVTHVFFRMGIRNLIVHVLLGVATWFAFVNSGVHATLAGVALGFLTPAVPWVNKGAVNHYVAKVTNFLSGGETTEQEEEQEMFYRLQKYSKESVSMQERLLHTLHPWVSYVIMPLFALANAGIAIQADSFSGVTASIIFGLVFGKPIGIVLFSFLAVKLRIGKLPSSVSMPLLIGGGVLAGIGFTMSLFVSELAFVADHHLLDGAKLGVLMGSLLAAIIGVSFIFFTQKPKDT